MLVRSVGDYMPGIEQRHRYDDIIMGFYGKAFDNGLQNSVYERDGDPRRLA